MSQVSAYVAHAANYREAVGGDFTLHILYEALAVYKPCPPYEGPYQKIATQSHDAFDAAIAGGLEMAASSITVRSFNGS